MGRWDILSYHPGHDDVAASRLDCHTELFSGSVEATCRKPLTLNRAEEVEKTEKVEMVTVSCHASDGSKWHLELLAMSADLQEKLQDPQFVATRCDLDGSGDLDPHELKQAARVYGISFSGSSGDNTGQSRISKERFADMVTSEQESTVIRAFERTGRSFGICPDCPQ
eukprot:s611_g25.t1